MTLQEADPKGVPWLKATEPTPEIERETATAPVLHCTCAPVPTMSKTKSPDGVLCRNACEARNLPTPPFWDGASVSRQ